MCIIFPESDLFCSLGAREGKKRTIIITQRERETWDSGTRV